MRSLLPRRLYTSGTSKQPSSQIEGVINRIFERYPATAIPKAQSKDKWHDIRNIWKNNFGSIIKVGSYSEGNCVQLYTDGDLAMEQMWDSITHARKRVWLAIFTLEPDTVGLRTLRRLTRAKQAGCDVVFCYDTVGSINLNKTGDSRWPDPLVDLRRAGATIINFNEHRRPHRWFASKGSFFRNHQKILITDDVGFCGSMNIAADYTGKRMGGTGRFRDAQLKIRGPAVLDLERVFVDSLKGCTWDPDLASTVEKLEEQVKAQKKKEEEEGNAPESGTFVQVLQSNVFKNKRQIQNTIRVALQNAQDTCYITTPYFLPPAKLKVRVLTAGDSDVPQIRDASQHIYSIFLRNNIKIYEMFGKRNLHAKMATMDTIYSYVGSFNLDNWSHEVNLEVNVTIMDPKISQQIESKFFEYLKFSKEVTLESLARRPLWDKFVSYCYYTIARTIDSVPSFLLNLRGTVDRKPFSGSQKDEH